MIQAQSANQDCYQPTQLPRDTSLLWIGDGAFSSDTVLIIGEGGPKYCLDFAAKGRAYWEYLPNHKDYYFAVVQQANTLNHKVLTCPDFTVQDAQYEVQQTIEIIRRAVQYFQDRGKFVVVCGHSYSAFVLLKAMAEAPIPADRFLLTAGRLDADSVQTAYQRRGINLGFLEDAKTLEPYEEDATPSPHRRTRYHTIRRNIQWVKYATGWPGYSTRLKERNLSNWIFYYGKKDVNIGCLLPYEEAILEQQGALVKGVDEDHYEIWKRVIDDFRSGELHW